MRLLIVAGLLSLLLATTLCGANGQSGLKLDEKEDDEGSRSRIDNDQRRTVSPERDETSSSKVQLKIHQRFQLPKLFDFQQFKKFYRRQYKSFVEELVRKKLFLTRTVRAFVSSVNYKWGRSSFYLSINSLSDWTKEELKKIYTNVRDKFRRSGAKRSQAIDESKLEHSESLESTKRRVKRSAFEELGSDPIYELKSERIEELSSESISVRPAEYPETDGEEIDHRESNCLREPGEQGECNCCYAFTAIGLYEWAHCVASGDLVSFSVQYVIDCGRDLYELMDGCDGGQAGLVGMFAAKFGFELESNYGYQAREAKCSHNVNKPDRMGYVRAENAAMRLVLLKNLDTQLRSSPIAISVYVSPNISEYGGGVDSSLECDRNSSHAMLLVGKGREDGNDYWLLRNSHGVSYGQGGYYKLNRRALFDCSVDPFGLYTLAEFKSSAMDGPQELYDPHAIKRKQLEIMRRQIEAMA